MNTATISHKGETISLQVLNNHDQADIAEHFNLLADGFAQIVPILRRLFNECPDAAGHARGALAIALEHGPLASMWEGEFLPTR